MSGREKNPLVSHPFNTITPSSADVPRGSQQDPKPEPMQGAPRWVRVAASDEGMKAVLEATVGPFEAPDADMQAHNNDLRQGEQ